MADLYRDAKILHELESEIVPPNAKHYCSLNLSLSSR
jgi:hypothetical protein